MATIEDIIGQASKKRYSGARYIGARSVDGGIVPTLRVKAWRKPNEDGASVGVVKTRELRLVGLGRILYSDAEMAEHFRLQDQRNADIMRAIR